MWTNNFNFCKPRTNQYGPWDANLQPPFRILPIGSSVLQDVCCVWCLAGGLGLMNMLDEWTGDWANEGMKEWMDQ